MSERREFRDLAEPERAREAISSLNIAPETESVPLDEARERVLAERVDARLDVPGFDRASMDGYAVQAQDTFGADESDPNTVTVTGAVHAGAEPTVTVDSGTCAEISTGAVMPDGADAVVVVEETDELESGLAVRTSVAPGDNVMFAGADIAAGARALGPGTEVTARDIGLLSALGREAVTVRKRPRVGIVSTGDELVRPGDALAHGRGEIYDVNSGTIAAGVEEAGGEAILYPHAGDDYEEMERLLVQAADECDLVLSSGSTSASAVDVIYRVIEQRGDLLTHGVAVKPGKPMLIGRLERSESADRPGESAYIGLPGYPVSALTIFRTFVAPAIREAAGRPEPRTAEIAGQMAVQERYDQGRMRLMPVGLLEGVDGETLVYPVDKGSGATTSLVDADGVVTMGADTSYLAAGEDVTVTLFSPAVRPPTLLGVGEDDPALNRLLDHVGRPRYLPVGSREGLRRLRNGLPDVAVTAGPVTRDVEVTVLGGWDREWGLIVPEGNPDSVGGLADLIDRDLRFVNRTSDSGLRTSLGNAIAAVADERDSDRRELVEAIDGFEVAVRAYESPARKVASGDADVGLGLRATAADLGTGFVPIGTQSVRVRANPDRTDKHGLAELEAAIAEADDLLEEMPGYRRS